MNQPGPALQGLSDSPGFSTAEKVFEISGRGIGMDAVLRLVRKNNGTITIKTEVGKGTEMMMRFVKVK